MANSDWYSPNLTEGEDSPTQNPGEEDPGSEPPSTFNCSLPSTPFNSGNYNLSTAIICALYMIFGIFCLFFGYRCFKAIMFFTGFIFASIVVYLICLEEDMLPMWSNALIAASAGLLFGLITLLVQYVGLFMLGFHSGLLMAIIGLCVSHLWINPDSPWISVGILLLAGLLMALLNLYFQKSLTILGSALYGSAILTTTLDYFVENSVMLLWVWDRVKVQNSISPCWFSWAILAVWPASMIIGTIVQLICTGKGVYHERQFPAVNQRNRRKPESREERKQRKYRYLYQVRTCHGDVISQPIPRKYVQQINETYSA